MKKIEQFFGVEKLLSKNLCSGKKFFKPKRNHSNSDKVPVKTPLRIIPSTNSGYFIQKSKAKVLPQEPPNNRQFRMPNFF